MTELITRPLDDRPDKPAPLDTVTPLEADLSELLLTTQAPQRPASTPAIRLEVDGRLVEGRAGQTILEVCRDNGIEVPTLCYEPKLPGFGACRMCVVEVEGEEHPPISCSQRAAEGMKVQTQTELVRRLRHTNLELIFSDHNAYCLPPCQNKCPSHIDIPGFLKANAEGNWRESARIYNQSRIVFNCTGWDEMNLRFYEAMATGSMLLANRLTPASGLFELFDKAANVREAEFGHPREHIRPVLRAVLEERFEPVGRELRAVVIVDVALVDELARAVRARSRDQDRLRVPGAP